MKIICIGRNYVDHIAELQNEKPSEPVVFIKPDSAILLKQHPFVIPEFSNDIHHEVEIVLKINRVGKHIAEQFAHKYYEEITVGIDFTARDIQKIQKAKGLPWEKAKGFDGAAPMGKFVSKRKFPDINNIGFHLDINDKTVQKGNTNNQIFSFDKIISFISQFITLKIGDLIYTGTPVGVGSVKIGDKLEAFLEGEKLLAFEIK